MKIAMLGHKRMPSREGGVEVVVEELSTRMAALGHDVTVYSRKGHNVAGSEYDNELYALDEYFYKGVRVKQVSTIDIRGLSAVTSSFAATRAAIADKPDIIHFHAEGPCAMMNMAKHAGLKTIATIHGLDWQRAKWGKLASGYIKHGEKIAAKYADEIIVLSENVRNYFNVNYGRNVTFIPNGVTNVNLKEASAIKKKYSLNGGDYILFLGRIVPEKGIHYLIEAYKKLNTNVKLVIAGGSSDSNDYLNTIKTMAAGDSSILFTGFVQGDELVELYSNALVYVLPSDLEGMPMSLLEAMSFGRCCLTSNINECSSVLSDCGVTFDRSSASDLKEKLEDLLANASLRDSLGYCAKQRIEVHYNWDNVCNRTVVLYKALVDQD